MAKGLSRMRGNSHVRFLGGWKVVTSSGYPVAQARRSAAPDKKRSISGSIQVYQVERRTELLQTGLRGV